MKKDKIIIDFDFVLLCTTRYRLEQTKNHFHPKIDLDLIDVLVSYHLCSSHILQKDERFLKFEFICFVAICTL